jgi:branched-chain amino acid transport system permease protein
MQGLLQQIMSGVAIGGVYACLALSMVMIYQTTHIVNFAQGEMAMASAFLAWTLVKIGVPYWVAFAVTLIVSLLFGLGVERIVMRRFKASPLTSVVIVMIGLMMLTNGVAGLLFGYEVKKFDSPFEDVPWLRSEIMSAHEVGVLLVTVVVMLAVFAFFRFTRTGLAMRAAAANPLSSQLCGVNVDLMLGLGWGLAALLGAVAGTLTAPIVYLDPNMMLTIVMYAFAGAVLGGIANAAGAVIGSILVGVVENLMGAYVIGTDLKLPFVLVVIVTTLTFRPNGLFGKILVTRV